MSRYIESISSVLYHYGVVHKKIQLNLLKKYHFKGNMVFYTKNYQFNIKNAGNMTTLKKDIAVTISFF